MSTIDILKSANQKILANIDEIDRLLAAREDALTKELEGVLNDRKKLKEDREVLRRAEEIHARLLSGGGKLAATSDVVAAQIVSDAPKPHGVKTRARIGPQRYFMMVALREFGDLTIYQIANITNLPVSRVREQMKADTPVYVRQVVPAEGADPRLNLTEEGKDLLSRFESYRRSEGKPLPTIGGSEDDETNEPSDDEPGEESSEGFDYQPSAQGG